MKIYTLIILLTIEIVNCNQNIDSSWVCNEKSGFCEKVSSPPKSNLENSQNVCRLICGKYGALWPIPTIYTEIGNELVYIHPKNVNFNLINFQNEEIAIFFEGMKEVFLNNLWEECGGNNCELNLARNLIVNITIASSDFELGPNIIESYELEVLTKSQNSFVKITADNVFGVRHSLETLSQLVASYFVMENNVQKNCLAMVSNVQIKDKPIFKHRGLLIDTARNFLTIRSIKKQIDAMAASKLNVLHWHATDSQSFPVNFQRVPQMARNGAYGPAFVYEMSDIKVLLTYAKLRGIRIIFELDAPSHAGNGWQWGTAENLGNLAVCVNKNPWRQYCIQPPCGQLNPANQNVYSVLAEIYKDLLDLFPRYELFHMGGDEVFLNCWNATEEITNYMMKKGWGRGLEDFLKLWAEYQEKSLQVYDSVIGNDDTPIILWSSQLTEPEHIEKYLSKNRYIIQTWVPTTNELPAKLLEKGYHLIISTKNAWYLDHGFWGSTQYYQWRQVYKNKIPRHKGVLGGEACMWGEYVDENSIDARIWPRTAAVAERLWSDPELDTSVVEARFYRHRDRLVNRGINADGLAPRWCFQNEGQCQ